MSDVMDHPSSEDAEEAFYSAMRRGDAFAVMQVWADEEDIICIHPNGQRLHGWQSIEASFNAILENGPVQVQASRQICMIGGALAVHNLVEQVTVSGSEGEQIVQCHATNVYVRESSGWRMIMHHAAPADDDTPALESAGAVLH